MFLEEIKAIFEKKIAPKLYRRNSEIYGLQYGKKNSNKIIKKIVFTIDLSLEAIYFALKKKVNLIISHHGLINKPTGYFNQNLINKLSLLSKFPISIFVLNSPFIAAEGGITDTILEALYLKLDKTFNIKNDNGVKVPIGRICLPKKYPNQNQPFKLEDLIKRIKTNLNLEFVSYIGDLEKEIKKICIVGGDSSNKALLTKVIDKGCDCFISGRVNYFDAIFARDVGLTLIETSHYKNEIIALKKICNLLSLEFPYVEFILFDSKDPYKTYF
ncbi:MAG: Nif3-like dinuclear metal center hexameric protein [Candidatus Hodarchaeota archaeon]